LLPEPLASLPSPCPEVLKTKLSLPPARTRFPYSESTGPKVIIVSSKVTPSFPFLPPSFWKITRKFPLFFSPHWLPTSQLPWTVTLAIGSHHTTFPPLIRYPLFFVRYPLTGASYRFTAPALLFVTVYFRMMLISSIKGAAPVRPR